MTLVPVLAFAACGPTMSPPDAGSDAGVTPDAGSTNCQEPYRRCQAEFRFRALDEVSVQLRGDFAADGWTVGLPMTRQGSEWVVRAPVSFGSDVQYKFLINNSVWVTDPANPKLSASGNSLRENVRCETFTCPPNAPEQGAFDWRDGVMAFVFVDRFFDADRASNCTVPGADPSGQYKGGDWKGVTQKINEGYFSDLGVNTLWLTVPVKNTSASGAGTDGRQYSAYHGYWPVDLEQYESCFGTKQDLLDLVSTAHAKGMQVLFDFAMVHLHSSAPVYAQHPEWFWPLPYANGTCVCGSDVCPWNDQGLRCWFTDYLPHWNYTVDAAREYSVRQAVRLLEETGADGFRLDAIKHVDGSWLTALRAEVEKLAATRSPRPRMYFVGETYDFGSRDYLKSFVDPATKLDGQFDFPLRLQVLEAIVTRRSTMTALRDFVATNDSYYGPNALMSPWIGNHDLGRVIHMAEDTPMWGDPYADGKDRAFNNPPTVPAYRAPFERLANAFVFLLTSPGVPLLYYGDEIGLAGGGDPDNRREMQWSGLSTDQLWLRGRVAALGTLRKDHAALRRGKRTAISATADTFVYAMSDGAETLYVAINRGDLDLPVTGLPAKALTDLYNQETVSGPTLTVRARSARVLRE
ncbi:MAG: alpha-amylase family glycosyl hydrolase [Myxococcota bacterium]